MRLIILLTALFCALVALAVHLFGAATAGIGAFVATSLAIVIALALVDARADRADEARDDNRDCGAPMA